MIPKHCETLRSAILATAWLLVCETFSKVCLRGIEAFKKNVSVELELETLYILHCIDIGCEKQIF